MTTSITTLWMNYGDGVTSSLSSTWQWKQTLAEGLTATVLGYVKMSGKCDLGQRKMVLSTGPALRPTYKGSPLNLGQKEKNILNGPYKFCILHNFQGF